jgi:hypothetical protein
MPNHPTTPQHQLKNFVKYSFAPAFPLLAIALFSPPAQAADSSISLSTPAINIEIDSPITTAGLISTTKATISVETTSPSGYTLTISTTTPNLTHSNPEISTPLSSSTGTFAAPALLGPNQWGMAQPNDTSCSGHKTNFTDTYNTLSSAPLAQSSMKFAAIPSPSHPATILESYFPTSAPDTTDLYFAATAGPNLTAGDYNGTITFTLVPKLGANHSQTSLIELIETNLSNNHHLPECQQNLTIQDETYEVDVKYFPDDASYSDQSLDADNDGTHDFTATTNGPMLIRIYEGNLTIDSGVTLTPTKPSDNGGNKGLLIYVRGTLTNNGTISMTARGANAAGQNIYLWQSEFVPAGGATGGAAVYRGNSRGATQGIAGTTGTARQTGGGGSGAASSQNNLSGSSTSSAGGSGTSYSGGPGGGGTSNNGAYPVAGSVGVNGGKGGNGASGTAGDRTICGAGGAGNPIGSYAISGSYGTPTAATAGTGGLLIIYAANLMNSGTISSNGSTGGQCTLTGNRIGAGGGGSGAGSINLFYRTNYAPGTITATGGSGGIGQNTGSATWQANGGAGGAGTITATPLP